MLYKTLRNKLLFIFIIVLFVFVSNSNIASANFLTNGMASVWSAFLDLFTSNTPPTEVAPNIPPPVAQKIIEKNTQTNLIPIQSPGLTVNEVNALIKEALKNVSIVQGLKGPAGPQGPSGPSGSSGSTTNSGVSRKLFDDQIDGTYRSLEDGIGGVYDSLSEEVTTDSLNVSGDVTLSGLTTASGLLPGTAGSVTTPDINIIDSTGDVGHGPSLSMASDGFARISYYDSTNGDLKYTRCTDADCTTSNIVVIDASAVTENSGSITSLKLGTDGLARIAYHDDTSKKLKYAICNDDDCSSPTISTVDDPASGNAGKQASLVLDDSDNAYISYHKGAGNSSGGNLMLARYVGSGGTGCTGTALWTCTSVDTAGQFPHIELSPIDGFARIAYSKNTYSGLTWIGNELHYVKCTNASCSTKTNTTVDSSENDVGWDPSFALDSDGFARIAYRNETSNLLKFAECTDDACSTSNITTIASAVPEGQSLVLGVDGFARVAYIDRTSTTIQPLKYIQCTNDSCSTKNLSTIDNDGSDFGLLSMVLGSDGFGRITYYDSTNDNLKFVRLINDEGDDIVSGSDFGLDSSKFGNIFGSRLNADELYLDGVNIDVNNISGDTTISGGLTVAGNTTMSGSASVSGPLMVNTTTNTDNTDGYMGVIKIPGATNPEGGLLITSNQALDGNRAFLGITNYQTSTEGTYQKGNIFSYIFANLSSGNNQLPVGNIVSQIGVSAAGLTLINNNSYLSTLDINSTTGEYINNQSYFYVQESGSTSNVKKATGFKSVGQFAVGGENIDTLIDFHASPFVSPEVATVGTRYGLLIDFTNTGISNAYGIYQSSSTLKNYFNGFVGIGMSGPSVALDVTGDIEYTGIITDVSDERLKENITEFESGLDIINSIGVKNYNMIISPDKKEVGFIAQDVEQYFPNAVSIVDPENGYMGVSYVSFVPVLTRAIQEISKKIDSLKDDLILWFADVGNGIGELYASVIKSNRVETNTLCIGNTCVTESELIDLLQKNNITDIQITEPEVIVDPEIIPETTIEDMTPPEEVIESTPEPEPILEEMPQSTSEIPENTE